MAQSCGTEMWGGQAALKSKPSVTHNGRNGFHKCYFILSEKAQSGDNKKESVDTERTHLYEVPVCIKTAVTFVGEWEDGVWRDQMLLGEPVILCIFKHGKEMTK